MPIDEDGDPKEPGGINGGFFQRGTDGLEETFSEINVPSINEYLKKIVSAGGKLVKPKGPILDIAYFAIDRSIQLNVYGRRFYLLLTKTNIVIYIFKDDIANK